MSQHETSKPPTASTPQQDEMTLSSQTMHQMLAHFQRLNLSTHLGLGLAHQINHPLSASVNYSQYCIKLLQDDNFDRNELLKYMTLANQETFRAAELIRRLRRFVSQAAPRLSTMHFNHAVLESVALLNPLLKEYQIDLQLDLQDDLPLIIGDRIQIEQVIFNLVINAIQSLADDNTHDPSIKLSTRSCNQNNAVCLSVRDNGPGIDADILPHIFEPFQTSRTHCMGIGLAMCRSICHMHHGDIEVDDTVQTGALIKVTLPIVQKPQMMGPHDDIDPMHTSDRSDASSKRES